MHKKRLRHGVRQAPRINRYAPRKRVTSKLGASGRQGAGLLPDAAQEIGGEASGVQGAVSEAAGTGAAGMECGGGSLPGTWG